jgi:hypothetical protein
MLRQHEIADRSEKCQNVLDKNALSQEKIAALNKKYKCLLLLRKTTRSIQANDHSL